MIEVIASRMGGFWYDGDMRMLTKEQWFELVGEENAVFAKAATDSCGGKGVEFIEGNNLDKLEEFLKAHQSDIVVQRPFMQHDSFEKLNSASVNTLRILSLLTKDGVKFYSVIVRFGVGNTKVDNLSQGGLCCGVNDNGTLKDTAYRLNGESLKKHSENGIVFDGYKIEGLDKAKELILKAHPMVPYFRMVSWDIAIDQKGDAYMIEANFAKGSVSANQLCNGPLFGEDTKKLLDEVFGKHSI
jgi:hypothetical protein